MANELNESRTEGRRARVLQLAYACSPWRGSEPGVGWHRAVEAAKYSDIWVICEGVEFEHQVLGHLRDTGMIPGLHFRFVRKTRFEQYLSKIPGMYYIAYRLWHRRAFHVAKSLHEEVNFDLVHQVNLCGYREPGQLGQMQLPFIWGRSEGHRTTLGLPSGKPDFGVVFKNRFGQSPTHCNCVSAVACAARQKVPIYCSLPTPQINPTSNVFSERMCRYFVRLAARPSPPTRFVTAHVRQMSING